MLPRSRTRRLREIFGDVLGYAQKKYPGTPTLRLFVGCPDIKKARRRGNPRAFFHVGAHPGKVCTVAEAASLSDEHLTALNLHELGHVIAMKEWGRSDQIDADNAVSEFLGIKIRYRGPLLLQWVPPSVVQRVLGRV